MKNLIPQIQYYFSANYLWSSVGESRFLLFYLLFPLAIFASAASYRIFLVIKGGRPVAYKGFDTQWFWGGITFGILGLFIYFSRIEEIAIFSTRLVSYAWIFSLAIYVGYLVYYFRTHIPTKLQEYYTRKRKAKYLQK